MFDWKNSNADKRNTACAQFMPTSDCNPLRRFVLTYDNAAFGQIPLQEPTRENAEAWLRAAKASRNRWNELVGENISQAGCPWVLRHHVGVREDAWHMRYSDTPGGAWTLVKQLVKTGWTFTITSSDLGEGALATKDRRTVCCHARAPMAEVVAICFLEANGVTVVNRPDLPGLKSDVCKS